MRECTDINIFYKAIDYIRNKENLMLYFKKGEIPPYDFQLAIKKPVPVKCIQIMEPFTVETMEGPLKGKAGDYLMIGIKGEAYPCDKEIFDETYEIVKDK